MHLHEITTYDVDKRVTAHLKSGVSLAWPRMSDGSDGNLSTIFRLVHGRQALEFRARWDAKDMGGIKTLLCLPYIDDEIDRAPAQDPLHTLLEPVYLCLWRYIEPLKTDPNSQFALIYGDEIYRDGVKQILAKPQD